MTSETSGKFAHGAFLLRLENCLVLCFESDDSIPELANVAIRKAVASVPNPETSGRE